MLVYFILKCFQSESIISFYILLWLAVGKPSFSSNVVEEIRSGCRSLQRSLIMVNLSEIFLGGMQKKHGLSKVKAILVCGFKNMCSSIISSTDVGVGNLLLVKCSQVFLQFFVSIRSKGLFLSKKELGLD